MKFKRFLDEGKRKQKRVFDKEKSDQKKALRIPIPPKGQDFKDKKRYTRKEKHKKHLDEQYNYYVEVDDPEDNKNPHSKTVNTLDDVRAFVKKIGVRGQEVRIWDRSKKINLKKPDRVLKVK
jgi:hypothetical protein